MPATGHACRAHDESNVANIGITHIERRLWFGYRLRQRDYSVTPLAAPALAHLAEQTLVGGDKAAIVSPRPTQCKGSHTRDGPTRSQLKLPPRAERVGNNSMSAP